MKQWLTRLGSVLLILALAIAWILLSARPAIAL